jgi:hypothetical protein
MRVLAAAVVLVLASVPARAGEDPAPEAMEGIADVGDVCTAMHHGTDPSLPCTEIGRVALTGGAVAELYEVGDDGFARWTIVIDDHGALSRSPTLELVRSNCGSQKCVDGEAGRPTLRKVRHGAAVSIELWTRFEVDVQRPAESGRYKTVERWHDYDAVECGPDPSGALACVTRHRTGRRPLD